VEVGSFGISFEFGCLVLLVLLVKKKNRDYYYYKYKYSGFVWKEGRKEGDWFGTGRDRRQ
jgi:hypothetical protein